MTRPQSPKLMTEQRNQLRDLSSDLHENDKIENLFKARPLNRKIF